MYVVGSGVLFAMHGRSVVIGRSCGAGYEGGEVVDLDLRHFADAKGTVWSNFHVA